MNIKLNKIKKISKKYKINKSALTYYGDYKAKIDYNKIKGENGKLILVTATNPTKFGEGKTTISIGLADALNLLNKKTVLALREPSLGPVFGIKGGATGGGVSQIAPMEDINLHFNGDFHAITSANNLLCSMIDNSLYFGNPSNLNPEKINFHRCLDLNDRALRQVELNIEGKLSRKEKFNITAASEIMSILTLSKDVEELKERIKNICIGFDYDDKAVYAKDLQCEDAVTLLLKDAIKPNLVQTLNGNPALIHLGPFANISHGCNSIIATKTALKLGDYVVTEAGFGADLGAQKFLDLICKQKNLNPHAIVLVTTIRSLKYNGGVIEENIEKEDLKAIKKGLSVLYKHYNNLTLIYNQNVVVAINKFYSDSDKEIEFLIKELEKKNIVFSVCEPYTKGGKGCKSLAKQIIKIEHAKPLKFTYDENDEITAKIEKIVTKIYGASKVNYSKTSKEKLKVIKKNGLDKLPVIIAKTQYSLSDNATKIGITSNFEIEITDLEIQSGAGYIVAISGKILLMPGLSKTPNAVKIKLDKNYIGNFQVKFPK